MSKEVRCVCVEDLLCTVKHLSIILQMCKFPAVGKLPNGRVAHFRVLLHQLHDRCRSCKNHAFGFTCIGCGVLFTCASHKDMLLVKIPKSKRHQYLRRNFSSLVVLFVSSQLTSYRSAFYFSFWLGGDMRYWPKPEGSGSKLTVVQSELNWLSMECLISMSVSLKRFTAKCQSDFSYSSHCRPAF